MLPNFMRSKSEIVSALTEAGVIAIVRTQSAEAVAPVVEALMAGGLNAIEITMTVPGALEIIRATRKNFDEKILLGAGTIIDVKTCQAVIEAGAEYIVSPITRPELVTAAHALGKPTALGAYTPTEAQTAHEAGSDFIKIFPADGLGPNYIKNLKAPLPHLRIVPTGGVTVANVGEWIRAGASAVGVGSALVSAQLLKDKNWAELTRLAAALVQGVRDARQN
jgi:2-dehydro-3-deoxyphosphogluconate aldolase/(4S)-4-hydroxy-2-oxoglutarate aldolase